MSKAFFIPFYDSELYFAISWFFGVHFGHHACAQRHQGDYLRLFPEATFGLKDAFRYICIDQ
ncbi:MAG: hypothetical protein J6A47_03430 [Bacilli bacterium]|nr:hypothetical protein [Bacilli bacterium]MBO6286024.1 hypothetical protein [Bacilli bacterium]